MLLYDREDIVIPYIIPEYGDRFEQVLQFAVDNGAVVVENDIIKYNIRYNRGLPDLYTEEELKKLFPIPLSLYTDMPQLNAKRSG